MSALELIASIRRRDPARPTFMEVVLAYPGFHAMTVFHPVAHFLWGLKLRALARLWSYVCRMVTGIEIHPGARVGRNLFIDHGTGVVIGETAIIGNDCTLYHGITLGGKGGETTESGRRHPVLGNNVIIGAGAQILGAITVGDSARVGANAVVTTDLPAHVTVVGNPARALSQPATDHCAYGLPNGAMKDPRQETIERLEQELRAVKETLEKSARPPLS